MTRRKAPGLLIESTLERMLSVSPVAELVGVTAPVPCERCAEAWARGGNGNAKHPACTSHLASGRVSAGPRPATQEEA